MLKSSLLRNVLREEKASAPKRRVRFIWQSWGENDEAVQARIRAKIERGELSENDQITIFRWPEPEGGYPPRDDRWENQNIHARRAREAS